jgi:hypothetical protein
MITTSDRSRASVGVVLTQLVKKPRWLCGAFYAT